jgi:hypothetical protein
MVIEKMIPPLPSSSSSSGPERVLWTINQRLIG